MFDDLFIRTTIQDIEPVKTAEDIINEIEQLSPEEYSKVEAYFRLKENGINLSPEFDSVDEMMEYIDSNLKNEQFNTSPNPNYGNQSKV